MQEQKTQQFARFYLKDIKTKLQKGDNKKNYFDDRDFARKALISISKN